MTETPSPFDDIERILPNLTSAGELLREIQNTVTDIIAIRVVDPAFTLPNPTKTAREIAPQITTPTAEMNAKDLAIFDMVEEVYLFVLEAVRESVRINLSLDADGGVPDDVMREQHEALQDYEGGESQ